MNQTATPCGKHGFKCNLVICASVSGHAPPVGVNFAWNREFKRVLVPLRGGPNGAFALEVASILVQGNEGEIVGFTVHNGKKQFDVETFVNENLDSLHIPRERIKTKIVNSHNVVGSILQEVQDYDLIVLGHMHEPLIYHVTRDSIPEAVAKACPKPLVMVKASVGIKSWVKRWF